MVAKCEYCELSLAKNSGSHHSQTCLRDNIQSIISLQDKGNQFLQSLFYCFCIQFRNCTLQKTHFYHLLFSSVYLGISVWVLIYLCITTVVKPLWLLITWLIFQFWICRAEKQSAVKMGGQSLKKILCNILILFVILPSKQICYACMHGLVLN